MNRTQRPSACPDFLEVFTDFVDGNLSLDRETEIRVHLDCCEGCLHHLAAYRRGVMAMKSSERDVDPASFWSDLERRLWTEGHLAGGREGEKRAEGWRHPALAMAAAACFAVVVFFAGMWGDHALHDARNGNDRPFAVEASIASSGPVVVESEPIENLASLVEMPSDRRSPPRSVREPTPRPRDPIETSVPTSYASLEAGIDQAPRGSVDERDPVERTAEAAYVASLERELTAWQTIERTRERGVREGLRRVRGDSRMSADGWVEPVRIGAAGVRTLHARAPITAWPVEAAISIP